MIGVVGAIEVTIGEAMVVLVVIVGLACSAAVLLAEWTDASADLRRRHDVARRRTNERRRPQI